MYAFIRVLLHYANFALSIALLIIVCLYWNRVVHNPENATCGTGAVSALVESALCHGNTFENSSAMQCQRCIQVPGGEHYFLPAPATQSCTNSCYVANTEGHCDPYSGTCVTAADSTCQGQCSDAFDCEDVLPLDMVFGSISLADSNFIPQVRNSLCILGNCYWQLAYISYKTVKGNSFWNPPTHERVNTVYPEMEAPCARALDQTFYAQHKECLRIEAKVMDHNMSSPSNLLYFDRATRPFLETHCMISFLCSNEFDPNGRATA